MNTGVFINWIYVTLVMIMLFPLFYKQIDLKRAINVFPFEEEFSILESRPLNMSLLNDIPKAVKAYFS